MPPANQVINKPSDPLRILGYGDIKTKKTLWGALAALAGWRVVILDADRGTKILKLVNDISFVRSISQYAKLNQSDLDAALARIYVVDIADTATDPCATTFMAKALTEKVTWVEQEKRVLPPLHNPVPGCSHYEIDLKNLGKETLLMVDTWTSIVKSMEWTFNIRNNINPSDAEKVEWPGFGYMGRNGTWMIKKLKSLNCHLMLVAHKRQYDKYKSEMKQGTNGQTYKDTSIEFSRIQPVSSSNPHGQTLGSDFDECYIFERKSSTAFSIDLEGDKDKDAGSRSLKPLSYKWDELQFINVAAANNIKPPTAEEIEANDAIRWHDIDEQFAVGVAATRKNVTKEGDKTVIKGGKSKQPASISSLFN